MLAIVGMILAALGYFWSKKGDTELSSVGGWFLMATGFQTITRKISTLLVGLKDRDLCETDLGLGTATLIETTVSITAATFLAALNDK